MVTVTVVGALLAPADAAESGPSGESRSGIATYYNDAGYGACGDRIDAATDMLVAMSYRWFTSANPNDDPLCGLQVEVTYQGKTITVPVADECPSCDATHIDLSQAAFAHFASADPSDTPGVLNVSWRFLSGGDAGPQSPGPQSPGPQSPEPQSPEPATGSGNEITGLGGKCIGAAWGVVAAGTAVDLYPCVGSATQQWSWAADGTVRNNGLCLEVADGGTTDGSKVRLSGCDGGPAQEWIYSPGRDIVNPQANRCLDVTGDSDADYTTLQIWTCVGNPNQKWSRN